jgi:lysophospholipase L1-like esterase
MSKKDDLLTFIDIWEAMLTEDGRRIPQLFVDDGLHINAEGYKIWTKLVRRHLESLFSL